MEAAKKELDRAYGKRYNFYADNARGNWLMSMTEFRLKNTGG